MSIRYEWTWDLAATGGASVVVDDDGAAFEVALTQGTYGHTSIATVEDVEGDTVARYAAYTAFAASLATVLNGLSSGAGTYTVTYSWPTGYTIAYSAGNFELSFTTTTDVAAGVHMRRILGMTGNRSGAASYASQARPWYVIVPAIEARSQMSDETEADDVTIESVTDDGTAYQISKDTLEVQMQWEQAAETEAAPSAFASAGTPPFIRQATSAVPWTYQHAWRHMRVGEHPFSVIESGSHEVHQIRAEGASFGPRRFAAQDYGLWSLEFRTRLIGRVP